LLALGLLAVLASAALSQDLLPVSGNPDTDSLQVTGLYASPRFIPNLGQFEERVRYVVPGRALSAWVERDALVLHKRDVESGRGVVLHFLFEESSPSLRWTEAEALPGHSSFFLGPDAERWQSRVPGYRKVIAEEFRPGVALELELHSGRVWYALRAAAGAILESVVVRVEGAERLSLAADGSVLVETALGVLRHTAPVAWEIDDTGARRTVDVSARVSGRDRIVLDVSGRHPSRPLVVDPGLDWATYLGGSGFERMAEARWHSSGEVTVAGETASLDFPVTAGAYDTEHGGLGQFPADVCLVRFESDGSDLVWSTYLGGPENEGVGGLGLLDSGEVIVGGWSASSDFPMTPGALVVNPGSTPNFATRLSADGAALIYSAVVGPGNSLSEMHVDHDETVVIAGSTQLLGYPTTSSAFMPTPPAPFPSSNVVIRRLSADGSHLVASTYLGGSLNSAFRALTLRPDGSVVVAGSTNAADFPVTPGAHSTTMPGRFLTCLDPLLERLVYSTGSGGGMTRALTSDASGAVIRTGETPSASEPPSTPGAFQPAHAGNGDAFVQRFAPDGSTVLASTFLGGGWPDDALAVVADSAGTMTVFGFASGGSGKPFPITEGSFEVLPNLDGFFVSRVSADAKSLWYSSLLTSLALIGPFLGGLFEKAGVDLDDEGGVILVGQTVTGEFPVTPDAFDPVGSTGGFPPNTLPPDGIVIRMDMLPHGVHKSGSSTPGCAGKHAIGVTAQPRVGSTSFGLTCTNAEPYANGLLLISHSAAAPPLHVQGAQLFVDPTQLLVMLPVTANDMGALVQPLRIPDDTALAGQTFHAQLVWRDTCSPTPSLSASNALSLTVQP